MPTGALDSILRFAVPIGAFAVFGFMIYRAFGDEIDTLFQWIKGLFTPRDSTPSSPASYGGSRRKDVYGMGSDISYQ